MTDSTESLALEALEPDSIVETPTVIEQLTRGEVDMQVSTAKRYPRSIKAFLRHALAMAIRSPDVAKSCFYRIPRGGKKIEGPSIRLAEIVAGCWGNLRCDVRVLGADETLITAQATAWDMEKNVLIRREVQRRITDSRGKRYSDDMLVVTGNAAASIALRNAIFSVVPRSYVHDITQHCMQVAAGERGSLDDARKGLMAWYAQRDITTDQVLELLGRPGLQDVTIDDVTTLQGLQTALADGETTLEELFGPPEKRDKNGVLKFGFAARQAQAEAKTDQPAQPDQKQQTDAAKPQKK